LGIRCLGWRKQNEIPAMNFSNRSVVLAMIILSVVWARLEKWPTAAGLSRMIPVEAQTCQTCPKPKRVWLQGKLEFKL
jgi:hypothetical protein